MMSALYPWQIMIIIKKLCMRPKYRGPRNLSIHIPTSSHTGYMTITQLIYGTPIIRSYETFDTLHGC